MSPIKTVTIWSDLDYFPHLYRILCHVVYTCGLYWFLALPLFPFSVHFYGSNDKWWSTQYLKLKDKWRQICFPCWSLLSHCSSYHHGWDHLGKKWLGRAAHVSTGANVWSMLKNSHPFECVKSFKVEHHRLKKVGVTIANCTNLNWGRQRNKAVLPVCCRPV